MNALRIASALAAMVSMGLIAGTFALYAHTIMPALRTVDDRTFVAAFQALDRQIVNPWFMLSAFGGALALTLVAAAANLGQTAGWWIGSALLLYGIAVAVTVLVHLPLNDAIKAAGPPRHPGDAADVRALLRETRWAAWNLVRVATSTTACGLLGWALVLLGRSGS